MKRMKRLMCSATLLALTIVAAKAGESGTASNATNRFEISGMHCDGCANGLKAEFKATRGVITADVTLSNKLAVIAFDTNRVTSAQLIKVATEAGYQAKQIAP